MSYCGRYTRSIKLVLAFKELMVTGLHLIENNTILCIYCAITVHARLLGRKGGRLIVRWAVKGVFFGISRPLVEECALLGQLDIGG